MTPAVLLALAATVAGALAPPPGQVVLTGRGSFGEIHFDHAAHLARHLGCATCHGPGPVHKPELTPATAHATCRACHVEQQRGPTSCRDCHLNVKEARAAGADPAAATTVTLAAGPAATGSTGNPAPTPAAAAAAAGIANGKATATANPAMRLSSTSASTSTTTSASTSTSTSAGAGAADADLAFRTALRAGLASISGAARAGAGFTIAVEAEEGHRVAGIEVDSTGRPGAQRTLALVGAGLAVPLGGETRLRAVALCGLDAGTPAYALPALGGRLGLELRGRGARSRRLPSAELSLAYLAALGARGAGDGPGAREEALVLALRLGWELPPR